MYIPGKSGPKARGLDELAPLFFRVDATRVDTAKIITSLEGPSYFSVIITDTRKTPPRLFRTLRRHGRIIGIDEGGKQRAGYDYLIDTLPLPRRLPPANAASPYFLALPEKVRDPEAGWSSPPRILIVFGGEDPKGLTGKTAGIMRHPELREHAECSVVYGPVASRQPLPEGVCLLAGTDNLREQLAEFDIVVTAFGLTAYEAAAAGCGVICVNPSFYHHRLAGIAGFVRAGVHRPALRPLRRWIRDPEGLREATGAVFSRFGKTADRTGPPVLSRFIAGLDFSRPAVCPVCGGRGGRAVYRREEKTIFRCRRCRVFYQLLFTPGERTYGADYFFSEYKKQYGRTYLEDFEHIKETGRQRAEEIAALLPGGKKGSMAGRPRLLDAGCAYGAFLQAASDAGFEVQGTDISPEAVAYVRDVLQLPAETGDFEKTDTGKMDAGRAGAGPLAAVSMWFVLEHFQNTAKVLRKAAALLPEGGVFAFSTPNGSGISRRSSPETFFSGNPPDHCTIWTPRGARKVLPRYGLNVVKIKITGHHPERFPWMRGRAGRNGFRFRLTSGISKLFRLGDTFEVYAVKGKK
jgi:SAM-dependent methyltransferase